MSSEIKFDMPRDSENGVCSLEDFVGLASIPKDLATVDITKEVQETFVMYQNLFGNKILDLNSNQSPFSNFNSVFFSTGKSDLGTVILTKTKNLSETIAKRFRLCILS